MKKTGKIQLIKENWVKKIQNKSNEFQTKTKNTKQKQRIKTKTRMKNLTNSIKGN